MFNKHFIAILFFVLMNSYFSFGEDQNASMLFRNARNCEDQGEMAKAKQIFEEIISEYPSSFEMRRATVRMARMDVIDLIYKGDYEPAFAKISTVTANYNDCNDIVWFLYSSASVYDKVKERDKAAQLYAGTIARNSNSKLGKSAAIKLARLESLSLIEYGQYNEANAKLSAVMSKYPEHSNLKWYIYSVASLYDELKERDNAQKYYSLYVQKFGEDNLLGESALIKWSRLHVLSMIDVNDYETADTEISKAINKYSGNKDLEWYLFSIASEYSERNERKRAKQCYAECIQLFPENTMSAIAELKCASIDVLDAIDSNDGDVTATASKFKAVLQSLKSNTSVDANWYEYNAKLDLYNIGCKLDEKGYPAEAVVFYDMFISDFSKDKLLPGIEICRQRIAILNAIDSGDTTSVLTEINRLIEKYPLNKKLPWCVYRCGGYLDQEGYTSEAANVYDCFIKSFPNDKFIDGVQIKRERINIVNIIKNTDSFEKSCTRLKQFKQNFEGMNDFTDAIFCIAEAYYEKGRDITDEKLKIKNKYFEKSIEIIENDTIPNMSNAATKASAFYELGLNRIALDEYHEAAEAFSLAVSTYPKHHYADYCVAMQGYCYRQLFHAGQVTKAEAQEQINAAYAKLVSEYSSSGYIIQAKKWLDDSK